MQLRNLPTGDTQDLDPRKRDSFPRGSDAKKLTPVSTFESPAPGDLVALRNRFVVCEVAIRKGCSHDGHTALERCVPAVLHKAIRGTMDESMCE